MSVHKQLVGYTFGVFGWLVTQTAMADATTPVTVADNGDYSYRFSDEDLLGSTLTQVGDMYRNRAKFRRVLLLRPRISLVGEILKSAEDL